jgi:integrase/recombinase XerD
LPDVIEIIEFMCVLVWLAHHKPHVLYEMKENIRFCAMSQARTLNAKELRKALDHVASRPHAARNRISLLLTHWAGMRVGEVAALRWMDVIAQDESVKTEIRLSAAQTKGQQPRTVFVSDRLRKEIQIYARSQGTQSPERPLLRTQKRDGFSANTLAQTINHIYRAAGLDGASSHSGRRSFITTLAHKGVGVRVLASLAGHRSISTTQRYIDVNDDQKRAAVELMG